MKALFVAGGTGGHVYPALEVAREFKNSGAQIYWIGKENSLEHEFSKREGFKFEPIKSSGFRKKSFIKKNPFSFLFNNLFLQFHHHPIKN